MPLATIADLKNETPENVALYLRWASELSGMYDRFLDQDDDPVSFNVGWGASSARPGGVHASEISGCQRKAVYSLMDTPRQGAISAFWKRKFHTGHLVHALIQNDLERLCAKSNGLYSFEPEVKISPELQPLAAKWDIHSSSDGVFVFHDGNYGPPLMRVNLEIKSEAPNGWEDLKEPKPEHREQATLYMACLDVPITWTLYYNKGTQAIVKSEHPWLFTFDHHLWASMEARIVQRRENARLKVLPEPLEGIQCEFCPYAYTCDPKYLKQKERMSNARKARAKARKRNPHKGAIQAPKVSK
jgi:hypothetical protein